MANTVNYIKRKATAIVCAAVVLLIPCQLRAQDEAEQKSPAKPVKTVKTYPTNEVFGMVLDEGTNAPIPGVKVQALGNPRYAAMTDEEGRFTIKVPEFVNALYVFSPEYLSQQVAIDPTDTETPIRIKLLSDKFYPMYDNSTTYTAVKKVATEGHYPTPDGNISQQLQGDLRSITRSGMIENGASMFIRGINSINATVQPLVLIDGIEQDMMLDRTALHEGQFMNQLANLSPNDIESIEVVKNATALYGSRGANGVILIKTKRGHSMATRIDADIYAGVQFVPTLPKMMNATQYRTYATEMIGTIDAVKDYNRSLSMNFLNDDPTSYYYNTYHNNTDWTDYIYRKAMTQNYSVNVQGGDDVGMYNLSVGYMTAKNTIKENNFDRFNIRFNTDIEIIPILKTVFNMSISRVNSKVLDTAIPMNLGQGTITSPNFLSLIKSPIVAPYSYNPQTGKLSNVLSSYDDIFSQLNNVQSGLGTAQALANPVSILKNGEGEHKNKNENTNFNITLAPTLEINKHLFLTEHLSYSLVRNNQKYYRPYFGVPPFVINELGTVYAKVGSYQATENNFVTDTRLKWGNVYGAHTIDVFGGFRYNRFKYDGTELISQYRNQTDDKGPSLNSNDTQAFSENRGAADVWKQIQWYGNADYNYQNKYFLTLSLLAETNSRFGDNAGSKIAGVSWAFFPSVQAGWVITNERWFKRNKAINYLRINAGYDTSGNDGISNYAARTSYSSVRYHYQTTGSQLTNIGNDEIKWELTKKFNAGLEANFINNRISFTFNYFLHKTSDLLTLKTFDNPIGGINLYWTNGGALKNEGFETSLSFKPVVSKDWNIEMGATLGHYKNKVTSLPDGDYTTSVYGDNNILTAVGKPVGMFYGYQTDGVFTTSADAEQAGLYVKNSAGQKNYFEGGDIRFIDQNGDHEINGQDKVVIGDPNPDIFGHIFANVNYKRLTLSLNFNYSLGNDIYNYQRSLINAGSNFYNQQVAETTHWRYEGQQTDIPRLNYGDPMGNNRFSDRWIEDGSYLRLKNLSLSYKVPVPNTTWLQGLTIWAEAQNLFILSKYKGGDPEFSAANGVFFQGIDAGNISLGKTLLFGVRVNL